MEDTNRDSLLCTQLNFWLWTQSCSGIAEGNGYWSYNYGSEFCMPFASVNKNTFHQNLLLNRWKEGKACNFSKYRKSLSYLCGPEICSTDSNIHCKGCGQILHWCLVLCATSHSSLLEGKPNWTLPITMGTAHLLTNKHSKKCKEATVPLFTRR